MVVPVLNCALYGEICDNEQILRDIHSVQNKDLINKYLMFKLVTSFFFIWNLMPATLFVKVGTAAKKDRAS